MSLLLTRDEYEAIAAALPLPSGAVIDGRARASQTGATFETINPANGQVLNRIAACSKADLDLAVAKARETFEAGSWSRRHPSERKKAMIQLARLIRRNQHELAVLESLESGKPIHDVETIDIPEALNCLEWHAETADKIYDEVAPSGDDAVAMIVREPVGVVGCVLPWNFPILMLAWKLGPALAAGNSVIVKPAEETSMTALRIAELAREAGIPGGAFQVVTGLGEVIGREIGLHPDIDMVSFTGSTDVGRLFLEYSAKSNLKRIVLECGGKNPCIVFDDADLDRAVDAAVFMIYSLNGERCTSSSRLLVQDTVYDEVTKRVAEAAKRIKVGHPLDPETVVGPLIHPEHEEKVLSYFARAREEGATIAAGGEKVGDVGCYVHPTLFTGANNAMSIAQEEIFGPVLTAISFRDEEEALAIANDVQYGLAAYLWTNDLGRAMRMTDNLEAGMMWVNSENIRHLPTPFGGVKASGIGRDGGDWSFDFYMETVNVSFPRSTHKIPRLGG